MTITECENNIGKRVTYIPFKGVITSVNNKYPIVRYGSNINYSIATNPKDLIL